jgi:hypothetical protein
VPIPLVLDDLVLSEIARGDGALITLLQHYDAAGQPLIVPLLALGAAYRQARTEQAEGLLEGVVRLEHAMPLLWETHARPCT